MSQAREAPEEELQWMEEGQEGAQNRVNSLD